MKYLELKIRGKDRALRRQICASARPSRVTRRIGQGLSHRFPPWILARTL
jgi:hypothetical protein